MAFTPEHSVTPFGHLAASMPRTAELRAALADEHWPEIEEGDDSGNGNGNGNGNTEPILIQEGPITFAKFKSGIGDLPAKEGDGVYEFEITDLGVDDLGSSDIANTLGAAISSNSNILLDLSDTVLPTSITDLTKAFKSCVSLVVSPGIPSAVTVLTSTFEGCTELEAIPSWEPVLANVTNKADCFKDCSSLASITVPTGTEEAWEAEFASGWGYDDASWEDIVEEQA